MSCGFIKRESTPKPTTARVSSSLTTSHKRPFTVIHDLYNRIAPACCYITVFVGDEKVSDGTGFAYTPNGEVLTAAHVVTGRWPICHDDYKDPRQKIYCKFPGLPVAEYRVFFCCIDIEVPVFTKRVQIDLAVLLPAVAVLGPVPYIPALTHPPKLGERVFMAGFSEEVRLPFDVNKLLPADFPGVGAFRSAMEKGYIADMTGPMFKQGYVGNISRVIAQNTTSADQVECDLMYIDNSLHYGASGGPVFNECGDAVGVVSQRAVTGVDTGKEAFRVPSGSTLAVSLAPFIHVARRNGVS
jgi:Trypsin-like peptidase domain